MNIKATVSVMAGGFLWGLISLFVTRLNAAGFDSLEVCFYRVAVAAVLLAIIIGIKAPAILKIQLKDLWMFVGTGMISLCLFSVCYFHTIQISQASIAVALLYTSPVFVTVLSALLFQERINLRKAIAVVITVAGCFLISGMLTGTYSISPFVMLTGIASGLFYGLYSIFGRYALKKYQPLTVTFYTFVFASLGSLLVVDRGHAFSLLPDHPEVIPWCIGISVLITILPYFFYTWGLKYLETAKAAVLVTVEPLVGCLVGVMIFNEPTNVEKMLGMGCILVSTIILNLPEKS